VKVVNSVFAACRTIGLILPQPLLTRTCPTALTRSDVPIPVCWGARV